MIISRFVTNLIYYDNIKKVYLWVHDILPAGENTFIQFHKTKFKAIISVSQWQKNEIINCHKLPEDKIIVSRNAILPKRFLNKNIERIPFRFIYTSSMDRGLANFVNMIKPLKMQYPSATFYIFGNSDQIESNILQQIKDPLLNLYVFLHERVSQDQLSIELLKSDVWLYPTTFYETYCISAVEAMAAGCLVAGITLGALTEIVDDRGVMAKDTTELLEKLIDVLDSPNKKTEIIERAEEWSMKQDFFSLAKSWEKDIFSL
jgi:glycosyltransferase involved in cell wall biosynthesis